jgi:hypothetical protein
MDMTDSLFEQGETGIAGMMLFGVSVRINRFDDDVLGVMCCERRQGVAAFVSGVPALFR